MVKPNPLIADVIRQIAELREPDSRVVFLSGNFNVVHPGHFRLLNFAAECGDILVVGVNADGSGNTLVPQDLRLESIRSIGLVDFAFLLAPPLEAFIAELKPHVVVKGKEFADSWNVEKEAVDAYGGKLLFSSGEVRFSSMDLLQRDIMEVNFSTIRKPDGFLQRHGFDARDLEDVVSRFSDLSVIVLGDLIVDEYVTCDPLGMSQEDPTIVVTPIKSDKFVGGAGIVAAHARMLGANVRLYSVAGNDKMRAFAEQSLEGYRVEVNLLTDETRPTTWKQRFRASGKTLLRVNHLRQHEISAELIGQQIRQVLSAIDDADLVIFSDFNYGALPQPLVDAVRARCQELGVIMAADSQASSQMGDISRFKGMQIVTPTEHEARLSIRDSNSGLAVVAHQLQERAEAQNVLITLGREGLIIQASSTDDAEITTDRLPAFNRQAMDVSGAGDSLLTTASLALAVGAGIWRAAFLGSIAAACQVSRVGNTPLTREELVAELHL